MKYLHLLLFAVACSISATAQVKQYALKRGSDIVTVNDVCIDSNGYIITTYHVSGSKQFSGIMKTNARGKVLWVREGIDMLEGAGLKIAANGDYLLVNKGKAPQYARLDKNGNILWSKYSSFLTVGGLRSTGITETPNGTIVVCGYNDFFKQVPTTYTSGWLKFANGASGVSRAITRSYDPDPSTNYNNFYFNDVAAIDNIIIVGGSVTNIGVQKSAIWKLDTVGKVVASWYLDTNFIIGNAVYNKHYITNVHTAGGKVYVSGTFHNNKQGGDTTREEAMYIAELDLTNNTYQAKLFWLQGSCYMNRSTIQFTKDGKSYAFGISPNKLPKGEPGYVPGQQIIAAQVINNNLTYVKRITTDSALSVSAVISKQDSIIAAGTIGEKDGYYMCLHAPTTAYSSCNIDFDTIGSMSFNGKLVAGPATVSMIEGDLSNISHTDSLVSAMQMELMCGDSGVFVAEVHIEDIQVYPNPNNGSFTIAHDGHKIAAGGIMIYDVTGRSIGFTAHNYTDSKLTITMPGNIHGIVYCIIQTDTGELLRKAITIL